MEDNVAIQLKNRQNTNANVVQSEQNGGQAELKQDNEGMADPKQDLERKADPPPKNASEAFAAILISVGGFGKWQWRLTIFSACGFFTSWHNLGAIFLAATPDHWCKIPGLNMTLEQSHDLKNLTLPWVTNKDGNLDVSKCTYYDYNYTSLSNLEDILEIDEKPREVACDSWFYDKGTYISTLVSEWDLVCDRRWMLPTVQATYMFGILCGAVIMSSLSDRFGRRPSSLICVVIFFVSSLSTAFSSSFQMALALRFFIAASGQGLYLVNYVLVTETAEQKGRTWLPCLYLGWFPFGTCGLPILAYFFREWRQLQLATSIPTVIMFAYFWILPESPRWLFTKGRFEEGITILKTMAETNGGSLPPKDTLDSYISLIKGETGKRENKSHLQSFYEFANNVKSLVGTPNMRRRNLVVFYGWFTVSSVFYGLSFSGYNLNLSLYALVLLLSTTNIPFIFLTPLILLKSGRKIFLIAALAFCGIPCLLILVIPNENVGANMALTVIGRVAAGTAFLIFFIYSCELVPTNIRNISMGFASMWGRIGSIISPFIVDLLGEVYYAIPSTIFGLMAILAGLLSILLPETGFRSLPESIEEIEALPR